MRKRLLPMLALLLCTALLLPLYGCGDGDGEGVTDSLRVEPAAVTYTERERTEATERITALASTWLYARKGISPTPAMRAAIADTVTTRLLPRSAEAGLDGAALLSSLSVLEALPTDPTPSDLLLLYERLSVLLTAKVAGRFLYGTLELALIHYAEEYAALAKDSAIFDEEAERSAACLSALQNGLGATRFSELLSVFAFGGSLLHGSLAAGTNALHTAEILKILRHHADYYLSLSFTERECAVFADAISFLCGELFSDRATPFTDALCDFADARALSRFTAALPQALSLYAALGHAMTENALDALETGDTAPLLSALSACRDELSALLDRLATARRQPTVRELAYIDAAGRTDEFTALCAALPSEDAILLALDTGDPALFDRLGDYLVSLAPALYFLYQEEHTQ